MAAGCVVACRSLPVTGLRFCVCGARSGLDACKGAFWLQWDQEARRLDSTPGAFVKHLVGRPGSAVGPVVPCFSSPEAGPQGSGKPPC